MKTLDEKALKVWNKAIIVQKINIDGKEVTIDTDRYRQDMCNAWIEKDKYGDPNHDFGWELDHALPISKGGTDHLDNLRPLNAKNNRSKADDFPSYVAVLTSKGDKNIEIKEDKTINEETLKGLKLLYPNNPFLKNI